MFTVIIALTFLGANGVITGGQGYKSKPIATEESCMEKLAEGLNALSGVAKEQFGPDGYLITGRCIKGLGDPA